MAHIVLIINTVLYFCIFILGMLIAVPLGLTGSKLNGRCILFGHVTYTEADSHPVEVVGGMAGLCSFIIYLHVVASIILALFWAILYAVALTGCCKGAMIEFLENFVSRILTLIVHLVTTFLVFSCSCVLSIGFFHFCRNIPTGVAKDTQCKTLQGINWPVRSRSGDGSSFYLNLMMAMGSSWICFLLWAIQTSLSLFVIVRQWRASRKRQVSKTTVTKSPIYKPTATEDPDATNPFTATADDDTEPSAPPEASFSGYPEFDTTEKKPKQPVS